MVLALGALLAGCGRAGFNEVWSRPDAGQAPYSAAAVDLNGDGYGDLVVGFPGGAEAYFGSAQGLSAMPQWTFHDPQPGSTGYCVGSAGHFSGDPHPILFVSAPRLHGRGGVYLFRTGPQGPEARPWRVLDSPAKGEGFGEKVVRVGDMFGDGYDDLAVADFSFGAQRGRVYVFRGAEAGPAPLPVWQGEGGHDSDWFGYSLSAPGDLDGDGLADLVIGSKNCNGSCLTWLAGNPGFELHRDYLQSEAWAKAATLPMAGKLSVLYGSKTALAAKPGLDMEGTSTHELYAYQLEGAGDVNGDGKADLWVGSIGWEDRRGQVELLAGGDQGKPMRTLWRARGDHANEGLGYALASIPALSGKGTAALLVGGTDVDSAWCYLPVDAGLQMMAHAILRGEPTKKRTSELLGNAGDLFGSGRPTLFIHIAGADPRLAVLRFDEK